MVCKVSVIDAVLNKSFKKLGIQIGKHPKFFIIVPVIITIFCMTGYTQLKYQIDPEYLFSPINGQGKMERALVEQYFKVNYTDRFNVERITRPGRFGRVIITSKDGDKNLIRKEVFKEIRLLDEIIKNTTASYEGDMYRYEDICARRVDECYNNNILELDAYMDEIKSGEMNLTFPAMYIPSIYDVILFPVYFGGSVLSGNQIISVPAIQMVYFARTDNKLQDTRGAMWEEAFLRNVGWAEDSGYFKYIAVARFASRTLDHELERNMHSVVPYFTSTFLLMAVFSVITCMMGDQVRSSPWLGLLGNISAIMATCAAFGLSMYLGIEFIGINLAAPFLMISIGIDDTFVMLAAWRRTSMKLSVPERMGIMMSDAAVSITITSVTDMVSFWIGILSPFRSVQIFCQYSAFAVIFTFIWHITFFAGCMAISGYMQEKNQNSLWCKVQPLSVAIKEKRGWFYEKFISGGISVDDPDNPIDNKEHILMAFFRDKIAGIINNKWSKALILLIFIGYLYGASYGLTQIKEGLERRKLSKADSYSVKFFDLEDEYYREFPYRIQLLITGKLNYSDINTRRQIDNLIDSLENTSYIIKHPLVTDSWIRSYFAAYEGNVTTDTENGFIEMLRDWLFPDNPFTLDVKFNDDYTEIIATRYLIQAVNITDTNHEQRMVRDLRQICRDSPLEAHVFHPYFVFFDQFELVRPTSIQSMCYGAVIMMAISYIFIPNILCSLWVAFSIVSIELGVAGYMSLWDVNLDSISMINLIMCIGFSVDFTAHICYAYMSSTARRPDDRVREALYSLGMPIIQGAVSTVLGCIGLLLADSYIFLVFFKMIFLVIFFGALHGLFLLPVLLSLFGPGSCKSNKQHELEEQLSKLEEAKKSAAAVSSTSASSSPYPFFISHSQLAVPGSGGGIKTFLGVTNNKTTTLQQHHSSSPSSFITTTICDGGGGVGGSGGEKGHSSRGGGGAGYGETDTDDKDQGIGTSGEDSSESSSSKSQRRRRAAAIEDEHIRGRYEEGWRRSSLHNLHSTSNGGGGGGNNIVPKSIKKNAQPTIDLYGVEAKQNNMWTGRDYNYLDLYGTESKNVWTGRNYNYVDSMYKASKQQQQPSQQRSSRQQIGGVGDTPNGGYEMDREIEQINRSQRDVMRNDRKKQRIDESSRSYIINNNSTTNNNNNHNNLNDKTSAGNSDDNNRYHRSLVTSSGSSSGGGGGGGIMNTQQQTPRARLDEYRRYSDETTTKRKFSDDSMIGVKRVGKYSPPGGIYRPNPNRSSSQHNLYYPRQPHQRSSSYHNLQQLRHTGDIRFP